MSRAFGLVLCLATVSCSQPPPPPPPPPLPADVEMELYAAILEEVLVSRVMPARGQVAAICLGFGEDAASPPVDLLFRFMGGEPPLFGSGSCTREVDAQTLRPVIKTLDGAPGLFVAMTNAPLGSGRVVSIRFEQTGARPYVLRCRVDMGRVAAPPGAPPDGPTLEFRIRGC